MAIVKSSLSGLEGVTASKISLTEGTVWFDPELTSPEQITRAITRAGYRAQVSELNPADPDSIPEDCGFLGFFC